MDYPISINNLSKTKSQMSCRHWRSRTAIRPQGKYRTLPPYPRRGRQRGVKKPYYPHGPHGNKESHFNFKKECMCPRRRIRTCPHCRFTALLSCIFRLWRRCGGEGLPPEKCAQHAMSMQIKKRMSHTWAGALMRRRALRYCYVLRRTFGVHKSKRIPPYPHGQRRVNAIELF